LPPVKGQQFFTKADVTLRKIHRQALDSPIIRQAHMVRLGRGYVADTDDFRVVRQPTPDDVREADIILCWRNVTRKACNSRMRTVRGYTAPHPQAGEPVMCLKNAPEYGVYNGSTYVLTADFRDGDDTIHIAVNGRDTVIPNVQFEDMPDGIFPGERAVTRFGLAYAATVHKAQGAEWDNVLLFDEYSMDEHRREWVYTSLTRAAKRITVVRR
jgi:exodeoxyribonuclease-5